jgi:plastocyanin
MIARRCESLVTAVAVGLICYLAAQVSRADTPGAPQIVIKNFMFSPVSITVKAGSTITWTNKDEEPHTSVSIEGLFRSGALDTNDSFSFKFDKPGTYHYLCSIHPQMMGTIVVQ